MFPLTSNEAYIKSTGERSTLGRMLTNTTQQIIGNHVVVSFNSTVEVAGDGTKTYRQLFSELLTAINTYLDNNPDLFCLVNGVNVGGVYVTVGKSTALTYLKSNAKSANIYFDGVVMTDNDWRLYEVRLNATASSCYYYKVIDGTKSDDGEIAPASGTKVTVYMRTYKKIS